MLSPNRGGGLLNALNTSNHQNDRQSSRYREKKRSALLYVPNSGGGGIGMKQNQSTQNVMFFDQFADDPELLKEEQELKDAEQAGKIQKAIKSIINLSRASLRLKHREECDSPVNLSDEDSDSSIGRLGALSEGDGGVLSARRPVDRKMNGPVVVVDCDEECAPSGSGGDPSSKSTVIKGVEPAFNEARSQLGIKSNATSSRSSFK